MPSLGAFLWLRLMNASCARTLPCLHALATVSLLMGARTRAPRRTSRNGPDKRARVRFQARSCGETDAQRGQYDIHRRFE